LQTAGAYATIARGPAISPGASKDESMNTKDLVELLPAIEEVLNTFTRRKLSPEDGEKVLGYIAGASFQSREIPQHFLKAMAFVRDVRAKEGR